MAAPKGSRGRPQTSSVSIAPLSPPQRRNPLLAEKTSYSRKSCSVVAPIWRDNVQAAGRAAWGRSCGSAKLVSGTLRCLRLCWGLPWSWSPVKQLGRCPKPHKGAPPLDPAKGSSTFWTPIRAIELASPPCFARVFILLALRLPPLPHDSIIPPRCQQIHQCINHRKHHIASNPDSIKQRVIMQSKCP